MSFPFEFLDGQRELGMLVALAIGFGFGFVLERAGFGRADKLAAQFYGTDMTVFKVMFSAIVTAMLGLVVLGGAGVVNTGAVLASAASGTFVWPMLVGGLVLGAGFIISGYCPGTSLVASASGKLDGMMTFSGVIVGSVLFGELYPVVAAFHKSGAMGQAFLDDVLGIPRPLLALGVTAMAVGCFIGAEKLEKIFRKRRGIPEPEASKVTPAKPAQRYVFAGFAAAAAAALVTLALPAAPQAAEGQSAAAKRAPAQVRTLTAAELAHRITDSPWTVRLLDLRSAKACRKKTIPGARCTPAKALAKLRLGLLAGAQDLVLFDAAKTQAPKEARRYRGRVFVLAGGYQAWTRYALVTPKPPKAAAGAAAWQAYRMRAAFHRALTGRSTPVRVKGPAKPYVPRKRKKKRGGCS